MRSAANLPKPDDSKRTSRHDNKVAEVVPKRHATQNWKRHMKLHMSNQQNFPSNLQFAGRLTVAPILPFIVITNPIIVLPSTHAPIAIRQLNPAAIIEDATSQFDTAHASAIQYAIYEPVPQVRFDGGIGSKSALDAFFVFAKLLGSWSTASDHRPRLCGRVWPISVDEVSPSVDMRAPFVSSYVAMLGLSFEQKSYRVADKAHGRVIISIYIIRPSIVACLTSEMPYLSLSCGLAGDQAPDTLARVKASAKGHNDR